MARKKKTENVVENPTPMEEDAMNLPEVDNVESENVEQEVVEPSVEELPTVIEDEKDANAIQAPIFKVISSKTSLVNLRVEPEGEVIRTVRTGSKVLVVEEKDGWSKVQGYIKSELLKNY